MRLTLAWHFLGGCVCGVCLHRLFTLLALAWPRRKPSYVDHTVNCPFTWEEKEK